MQHKRWALRIGFSLLLILGIGLIVWGPKLFMDSDKEALLTADLPSYFTAISSAAKEEKSQMGEEARKLAGNVAVTTEPIQYLEKVSYGDHLDLGEIVYHEHNKFQDTQVLDVQVTRPDRYGFFEKSFLLDVKGGGIQILAREKWSKGGQQGELEFHGANYIAGNQIMVKIRPNASPSATEKLFRQYGLEVVNFEPHSSTYLLSFLPASARDVQDRIAQMKQFTDVVETAFPNLLIIKSRESLRGRDTQGH